MAAVGFELMTLGFRGMAPTHCAIGVDNHTMNNNFIVDDIVLIDLWP